MTTALLRQACLALVAPAVATGAVGPGRAAALANAWASFVATGVPPAPGAAVALVPLPPTLLRRTPRMQIQIPAGFFGARLPIAQPVDASGVPTTFGGPVTWESKSPQMFDARPDQADGMVGLIVLAQGAPEGDGDLLLTALAGAEAGAPTLTNDVTVSIIPGDALGLNPLGVELLRSDPAAP